MVCHKHEKMEKFQFLCMFMLVLMLALYWLTHCFLFLLLKAVRAISCVHKKINFRVPIQNFAIGHNHQ